MLSQQKIFSYGSSFLVRLGTYRTTFLCPCCYFPFSPFPLTKLWGFHFLGDYKNEYPSFPPSSSVPFTLLRVTRRLCCSRNTLWLEPDANDKVIQDEERLHPGHAVDIISTSSFLFAYNIKFPFIEDTAYKLVPVQSRTLFKHFPPPFLAHLFSFL